MDQPGKVVNPARGQLDRKNELFPYPCSLLRIWSHETGSAVPSRASPLILYTQTESLIWCLLTGFLPIPAAASIYLCADVAAATAASFHNHSLLTHADTSKIICSQIHYSVLIVSYPTGVHTYGGGVLSQAKTRCPPPPDFSKSSDER